MDDWEQSISVISTIAICAPPDKLVEERRTLCVFGLHAMSRRIERNPGNRSDDAIFKDLRTVAFYTPTDKEFEVLLDDGHRWVGEAIKANGHVTLMVRTYI